MKKVKLLTGVLTVGILLCGCVEGSFDKEQDKATTGAETTKEQSVSEDTLRELIDKNVYCNLKIFCGSLPTKESDVDTQTTTLHQVSEEAFPDYASFEKYVRSVYCKDTADMYLYNYPTEGAQKYRNVDGKLYIDLQYDNSKGYYVIWDDYTITIDSSSADKCEFTVKAAVEMPADKPVKEEYTVKGTAVYENGKWVLTEMLY